jgi:hypothetical protein
MLAKGLGSWEAACHAEPRASVGAKPGKIATRKPHCAVVVRECAAQAIDERALARAIGPDQADALARRNRKIDIVERDEAAEPLR